MKQTLTRWNPRFLFLLFFTIFGVLTQAQAQTTVSGTVLAVEDGMPLIGATIREKGVSNGTVTDLDGNFSLTVANAQSRLLVS